MKKTLIINIGNSIIHIEEDAYEILTSYLNEIKQHFAKNADDFEIVKDIENRIAEMLNDILYTSNRPAVDIADVQLVITQMGRVKDFEPEQSENEYENDQQKYDFTGAKKLYRDTDEGVIAGVCAGLAHYFEVEVRWIRLITFLCIFLGGCGILAYVILWIAMPSATTRAQRMQMKGEATNLYGYKRSFDEELAAFKQNPNEFVLNYRKGNTLSNSLRAMGKILSRTIRLLVKFVAIILVIFGFIGLICLVIALSVLLGISDTNPFDFFPLSIINQNIRTELTLAAFVVCFVPLFSLILFAIKVAFNKRTLNKTAAFALLIIWLIGIGYTGYYATKISAEFQEHAELVKNVPLKSYKTYAITADNTMGFSKQDSLDLHIGDQAFDGQIIIDNRDDHLFKAPRKIQLTIEKSDDGTTIMTQNFQSQGKTFQKALINAQNISYQYKQTDSLLILSPRLLLKEKAPWRNQEVNITLKVPIGTHIKIHQNVNWDMKFYYSCDNQNENNSDFTEWIMTAEGLKCKAEITTKEITETENRKAIEYFEKQLKQQRNIEDRLKQKRAEEIETLKKRLEELPMK